jgi:hypothetical protein
MQLPGGHQQQTTSSAEQAGCDGSASAASPGGEYEHLSEQNSAVCECSAHYCSMLDTTVVQRALLTTRPTAYVIGGRGVASTAKGRCVVYDVVCVQRHEAGAAPQAAGRVADWACCAPPVAPMLPTVQWQASTTVNHGFHAIGRRR